MAGTAVDENKDPVRLSDSNTDSDRVLMTKRAIFYAFRDLVAERDFTSVTASDIMMRAGVSRSTFYRCFSDKFDIANWAFKRFKSIRLQDRSQYYSFGTSLQSQLEYLSENKAFFLAALRYRGQNSLHDSMVETNEEYMVQCWRDAHGQEPEYPALTAIRLAAAGCAYVVESWVVEGCKQQTAEVVSAVCACIPSEVYETLY